VVTRGRERGFSLLEIVIVLAMFGAFLWIVVVLTAEMVGYDKRLPVNYLAHPQVGGLVARLRRDVSSACCSYYPDSYATYTQSSNTLIVETLVRSGFSERVVWDFSTEGEAHRHAFSAGAETSHWVARGLPRIEVADFPIPNKPQKTDSVRIKAYDKKGRLALDQIFQPRAH
jgi:prepilin-type N-terminal cleavage/methylation domain-containing protein